MHGADLDSASDDSADARLFPIRHTWKHLSLSDKQLVQRVVSVVASSLLLNAPAEFRTGISATRAQVHTLACRLAATLHSDWSSIAPPPPPPPYLPKGAAKPSALSQPTRIEWIIINNCFLAVLAAGSGAAANIGTGSRGPVPRAPGRAGGGAGGLAVSPFGDVSWMQLFGRNSRRAVQDLYYALGGDGTRLRRSNAPHTHVPPAASRERRWVAIQEGRERLHEERDAAVSAAIEESERWWWKETASTADSQVTDDAVGGRDPQLAHRLQQRDQHQLTLRANLRGQGSPSRTPMTPRSPSAGTRQRAPGAANGYVGPPLPVGAAARLRAHPSAPSGRSASSPAVRRGAPHVAAWQGGRATQDGEWGGYDDADHARDTRDPVSPGTPRWPEDTRRVVAARGEDPSATRGATGADRPVRRYPPAESVRALALAHDPAHRAGGDGAPRPRWEDVVPSPVERARASRAAARAARAMMGDPDLEARVARARAREELLLSRSGSSRGGVRRTDGAMGEDRSYCNSDDEYGERDDFPSGRGYTAAEATRTNQFHAVQGEYDDGTPTSPHRTPIHTPTRGGRKASRASSPLPAPYTTHPREPLPARSAEAAALLSQWSAELATGRRRYPIPSVANSPCSPQRGGRARDECGVGVDVAQRARLLMGAVGATDAAAAGRGRISPGDASRRQRRQLADGTYSDGHSHATDSYDEEADKALYGGKDEGGGRARGRARSGGGGWRSGGDVGGSDHHAGSPRSPASPQDGGSPSRRWRSGGGGDATEAPLPASYAPARRRDAADRDFDTLIHSRGSARTAASGGTGEPRGPAARTAATGLDFAKRHAAHVERRAAAAASGGGPAGTRGSAFAQRGDPLVDAAAPERSFRDVPQLYPGRSIVSPSRRLAGDSTLDDDGRERGTGRALRPGEPMPARRAMAAGVLGLGLGGGGMI